MSMSNRGRHFFYLFLLAFSVRILYLCELGQSPFFFPAPGLDPFLYHQWATDIAQGRGMGSQVYQAMPLYPYFLGLLYLLPGGGFFWAMLAQSFLGALSVLLVYGIGRMLFSPAVAWIAALVQAFSGIAIFYDGILVPVTLVTFLFILVLFLTLKAHRQNRIRDWVGVGVAGALTVWAHAGILLFLPFLFFWMLLDLPGAPAGKLVRIGIVTGCVSAALGLVFLRNVVIAKDPVLLTSHSGINFYIGNRPGATGRFQSLFSRHTASRQLLEESHQKAEEELGRELSAGEASRYWSQKGLVFIRTEPAAFSRLLLKKFLLFWNGYEIPDVRDYHFFRSEFHVLRFAGLPFAWIVPIGLLGILAGLGQLRRFFLLYAFGLSQMAAVLSIFVNSRYRSPLVFAVILFAASALVWAGRLIRERRYGMILTGFFILMHAVFLTRLDVGATDEGLEHYNRGVALSHAGEHGEAVKAFEKALWLYPEDEVVQFAMANAHFRDGSLEKARQAYEQILSDHPDHADSWFNLGVLHFSKKDWEKAEAAFVRSASLKQGQADVYYFLSEVYQKQQKDEEALAARQKALSLGLKPEFLERDVETLLLVR